VAAVFRLLGRHGISQRAIAARTGQSQSEISEIIAGRQVMSINLLERIADGLGSPRSLWRLSGEVSIDVEQALTLNVQLQEVVEMLVELVDALSVALGGSDTQRCSRTVGT
jgi:transcriptional regulator with XRE-family HTH domain